MDKEGFNKFVEASDTVYLVCVEDTLDHPEVCEACPVRQTYRVLREEVCGD